jgi:hypothetical protein
MQFYAELAVRSILDLRKRIKMRSSEISPKYQPELAIRYNKRYNFPQ